MIKKLAAGVSAQTGYDGNDFMQFNFNKKKRVFVCGTNRSPDFAAQLVERVRKP